ncbi:MAG: hypothetical protein R6W86_00125 [Marinobacter sp.]
MATPEGRKKRDTVIVPPARTAGGANTRVESGDY